MIKAALVGNIASGKSVAENILLKLGYKVLDTDKVCHKLLYELDEIAVVFRNFDVFENGRISREKLGKLVFDIPDLKQKLENILYPHLRKCFLSARTQPSTTTLRRIMCTPRTGADTNFLS